MRGANDDERNFGMDGTVEQRYERMLVPESMIPRG